MSGYRVPTKKSKYYVPTQKYHTTRSFCLQYREWMDEYNALAEGGMKAIIYTGMPHGSGSGNPTAEAGERMAVLSKNIKLIQDTVTEVAPELYKWLLKGVTERDVSFDYLKQVMSIPCERDYYYDRRQKFYYTISKKLEEWL